VALPKLRSSPETMLQAWRDGSCSCSGSLLRSQQRLLMLMQVRVIVGMWHWTAAGSNTSFLHPHKYTVPTWLHRLTRAECSQSNAQVGSWPRADGPK